MTRIYNATIHSTLHFCAPARRVYHDTGYPNGASFTSLAQSECERIQLANLLRERFWPKKAPPWSWTTNPLWTIATRLAGNSNKSCDKVSLLRDTVDTIAAAGHAENTIYTDAVGRLCVTRLRIWWECGGSDLWSPHQP